ncbi:enoyl-CoA hydratase/isomerase family protein [Ornithinimicrobium sediminis]|uniref:enoyl-CoA hydratase/isomerase family protein n=1 Tax=Ornithinimicrobium sediminis TaxID=2904603 RepID=UPI001E3692DB|nr:enoyl-CoA hydratase-related protein [Ornithinimicrobium sediminis]MCE0485541.1 enoyl-CoA hydratase-related protein [Ornithinimicrobium sediminis]
MSEQFVRVEVEGGIATLRIDRGKMNPLDIAVQDQIGAAARQVSADDDVAAVIVYGGEKVFAAGADIKEMQAMTYTDMVDRAPVIQECFRAVAQIPKPTVAAITGYALGAGCELALCCDFRIAAVDAKLGQPEILLGVIPGAGGSQRLPRLIGPSKAKDLIFTGRMVDAHEALQIGLVDEVVEPGEVYAAARARMSRYVLGPAYALRAAKEAVDRGMETDLETGLAIEAMQFAGVFATKDREIGMTSFVEHGPGKADFEGR